MLFCSHCGARIPEDAGFCYKCGAKIIIPEWDTEIRREDGPAAAEPAPQASPAPAKTEDLPAASDLRADTEPAETVPAVPGPSPETVHEEERPDAETAGDAVEESHAVASPEAASQTESEEQAAEMAEEKPDAPAQEAGKTEDASEAAPAAEITTETKAETEIAERVAAAYVEAGTSVPVPGTEVNKEISEVIRQAEYREAGRIDAALRSNMTAGPAVHEEEQHVTARETAENEDAPAPEEEHSPESTESGTAETVGTAVPEKDRPVTAPETEKETQETVSGEGAAAEVSGKAEKPGDKLPYVNYIQRAAAISENAVTSEKAAADINTAKEPADDRTDPEETEPYRVQEEFPDKQDGGSPAVTDIKTEGELPGSETPAATAEEETRAAAPKTAEESGETDPEEEPAAEMPKPEEAETAVADGESAAVPEAVEEILETATEESPAPELPETGTAEEKADTVTEEETAAATPETVKEAVTEAPPAEEQAVPAPESDTDGASVTEVPVIAEHAEGPSEPAAAGTEEHPREDDLLRVLEELRPRSDISVSAIAAQGSDLTAELESIRKLFSEMDMGEDMLTAAETAAAEEDAPAAVPETAEKTAEMVPEEEPAAEVMRLEGAEAAVAEDEAPAAVPETAEETGETASEEEPAAGVPRPEEAEAPAAEGVIPEVGNRTGDTDPKVQKEAAGSVPTEETDERRGETAVDESITLEVHDEGEKNAPNDPIRSAASFPIKADDSAADRKAAENRMRTSLIVFLTIAAAAGALLWYYLTLPENVYARHLRRADDAAEQGDIAAAAAEYNLALEIRPDSPIASERLDEYWNDICGEAENLTQRSQFSDALDRARILKQIHPDKEDEIEQVIEDILSAWISAAVVSGDDDSIDRVIGIAKSELPGERYDRIAAGIRDTQARIRCTGFFTETGERFLELNAAEEHSYLLGVMNDLKEEIADYAAEGGTFPVRTGSGPLGNQAAFYYDGDALQIYIGNFDDDGSRTGTADSYVYSLVDVWNKYWYYSCDWVGDIPYGSFSASCYGGNVSDGIDYVISGAMINGLYNGEITIAPVEKDTFYLTYVSGYPEILDEEAPDGTPNIVGYTIDEDDWISFDDDIVRGKRGLPFVN